MAATRHQYRIYIKATPERVWQALIDPEFTRKYFHGTAFEPPPSAGGPYRSLLPDGRQAVEGVVEELDPPRRFVHTWRVLYDAAMSEEPPSRVEWTLTPVGEGLTQLDLVHGDLARSPLTWANVKDGWIWILDAMKTLLETGELLPGRTADPAPSSDVAADADLDAAWHRAQAIECNNAMWELLDGERNPADDEELLRSAFASAYHWDRAERRGPENEARALYMLSKAHHRTDQPERALHYARACLGQCATHSIADFDLAYGHEAAARALQALGRTEEASIEWRAAHQVTIADPENKAILDADLEVPLAPAWLTG